MNAEPATPPIALSIAAVERDTGLSKDTLRVWERRYGFPAPGRDEFGERAYPLDQVEKLRLLKRLLDQGHRPGKVVALPMEQLRAVAEARAQYVARETEPAHEDEDLAGFVELVKQHRVDDLRRQLSQAALRRGLAGFVMDIVAPLNDRVGEAWTRGYLEVFEEHLYSESIQVVLRSAINGIPVNAGRPRIVLTTFPQEPHGLGVLMAEAIFSLEGALCVSLGVQTPIWDISLAAQSQRADIVALSFSACLNPNQVIDGLAELRSKVNPAVQIWAGGACPILHRRSPVDVHVFRHLNEIGPALESWRASHPLA